MKRKTKLTIGVLVTIMVLCTAAVAMADKPGWWQKQEDVSNRIAEQQIPAVQYPEEQMKDSLERRNLRERLLRFNKPDKIGYLYLLTYGKFVGYYVIKGKVSSTQSQMTNTTQTWEGGNGRQVVAESIGDDGSFGPNEGGDQGIFFFTSAGVLVETTLAWIYSDTPLNVDVPNLKK